MRSYVKVWFGSAATNSLILLGGIVSGVILARLLEPEGRGVLAAILFWPHFIAGVSALGLNESITIDRARSDVQDKVMQSTVIWLSVIVAAAVCIVFTAIIPHLLTTEVLVYQEFIQKYFIVFVVATMLYMNLSAIDLGNMQYGRYNLFRILQSLCYPACILIYWSIGELTIVHAAYSAIAGVIIVSVSRLIIFSKSLIVRPSALLSKSLLTSGIRLHGTNLVMYVVAEVDKMFLVRFSEAKDLGLYVVALTVAATGQGIIAKSFADIILPRASQNEPTDELSRDDIRIVQRAFILILIGNSVLFLLVPWLLPFVFGQEFAGAILIAQVLLGAFLFQGVKKTMIYILRAKSQNLVAGRSELLVVAIFILCVFPLYSSLGNVGVACALLAGHIVGTCYLVIQCERVFHVRWKDWLSINLKNEMNNMLAVSVASVRRRFGG